MEIPDVVSVKRFKEFNATEKDELYQTLLNLFKVVEEIPKKSLRKTLEVTLAVLQYKGEQVHDLQDQLDSKSLDSQERLMDENDKLRRMIENLEDEKHVLSSKVKELTDEIFALHKRLQDAAALAEGSDKDSSDPLSELDKQEELLRNINTKNKHIKRLLREIETLQNQNIEQSKTIIQTEKELQTVKEQLLQLSADITQVDDERKSLKEVVNELNVEITRLESSITFLEEQRDKSERELKNFIEKLEEKAQLWKHMLDEKDKDIKKLRKKLEKLNRNTDSEGSIKSETTALESEEVTETIELKNIIESRNLIIEQLEKKIKKMAQEMIRSTKLMNKISTEKEDERNPQKPRTCCKSIEEALQACNDHCRELTDMLETAEEESALKSKQAMEAIAALEAYQHGEDGLVKALRKCGSLEQKLASREKRIQTLVTELNSMHEIIQENKVLRKRLHIPDDVVIVVKNFTAKERNKDKIIERLKLKLRASEEMRLQLKLEKNELKNEVIALKRQHPNVIEMERSSIEKIPSEVGEVEDSTTTEKPLLSTECSTCRMRKENLNLPMESEWVEQDVESKYQEIITENDTLRVGMHEILSKLREYDDNSDHITIDSELLLRLIESLRTVPPTSNWLQQQLKSLEMREKNIQHIFGMQMQMKFVDIDADELSSVQSIREGGEICDGNIADMKIPNNIDTSTRPSSPNVQPNVVLPVIDDAEPLENNDDLKRQVKELQIYEKYYEELKIHMSASELELQRYCADLVEQIKNIKLELNRTSSSYDFMRKEFDSMLTEAKQKELRHIEIVSDMQKDHKLQTELIKKLEFNLNQDEKTRTYNVDEYLVLEKTNAELRAQLAYIIEHVLTGKLREDLKITELCTDYGVIRENMELDYLTFQEYEDLKASLKLANETQIDLERKILQLEGLLEIAQNQIQSQQNLLNEITDNHINLRHLVADLQSTTEDKLVLAKMQRDIDNVKSEYNLLKLERNELKDKCQTLKTDLNTKVQITINLNKDFQKERKNKDIKIKFLQKSLYTLKEKYSKFTPLIFLTNFVYAYTRFMQKVRETKDEQFKESVTNIVEEIILLRLQDQKSDESQNLIKLVKTEMQCKLLEENLAKMQVKCEELQQDLTKQRIENANESEHWQTIEALFSQDKINEVVASITEPVVTKVSLQFTDASTNTEPPPIPAERKLSAKNVPTKLVDKNTSPISSPVKKKEGTTVATQTDLELSDRLSKVAEIDKSKEISTTSTVNEAVETIEVSTQTDQIITATLGVQSLELQPDDVNVTPDKVSLEKELQEARKKILETEEHWKNSQQNLQNAQKRIEELQNALEANKLDSKTKETSAVTAAIPSSTVARESPDLSQQSGIIEKTILSFHALLTEKDKSISKYQDLLQTEREHTQNQFIKLKTDIDCLQSTVDNLNVNIKSKDLEILELKTKLESTYIRRNSNEKIDLARTALVANESVDNSLNELSDEKIEEMFEQESSPISVAPKASTILTDRSKENEFIEKQDKENLKEVSTLMLQIKKLKERLKYVTTILKGKEEDIKLLKEKLQLCQEREKSVGTETSSEVEQLRTLLDEKDKHINELMETLKTFHDDQQRYIDDSSNYTADQISKLASDLTRTEATNKIYQTQVEALRRQLTAITQREKQAREQNQTLRNQLIKRPVVSIKSELNARVKNENLQKRVQQLELDLEDARVQIRKQNVALEAKRAKSNAEIHLWDKQKRWQQNAEKLKLKLEENETTLEKTRTLLQSARTTINRLEKDKQMLESKMNRPIETSMPNFKCCRTPSCPNLRHTKYLSSETPELYAGNSSESSSPIHSAPVGKTKSACNFINSRNANSSFETQGNPHEEIIEALKARIEFQQRKIIAMELEGKGTNALTTEMEKLQEKLSKTEAHNVRLEARNLQLQLNNDLFRQGDETERLQKRIKHLEDYIIALKEELAHVEVREQLCKCSSNKPVHQPGTSADQTILSLKRIVEKLRVENKYLKDGRRPSETRSVSSDATSVELTRLQQLYTESLDKISLLHIELNEKTKNPICNCQTKIDSQISEELRYVKEQLIKKCQLLEKAKVLLTRAAAKEKILKEQVVLWKRKCSELQNVPVIDEISE
ncbi:centrosomal protein cep290 [Teleopsis dalmanni]|uniref:centrosomal protein cep290 n=1 Tax=Teleopsis dalmanni TaxID=139649 RepID=UPI0018CD4BBC|nr:centrosomal protein cep290 [Teleopsis dalmanni]